MIRFNIKLALRNLLKNKVYSALIIGGFSIGFAACILIGLFYYAEHRVNKDFALHEQIYRLYDTSKQTFNLDYELYPVLAENYPEVEYACPMGYLTGLEFSVKDEQLRTDTRVTNLLSTNNNFFSVFTPEIVASTSTTPFAGNESAVITESLAQRLYGDKNPLGQTLNIHNLFDATITAVIKDLPKNSTFNPEILLNNDNEKYRLFRSCNNGVCRNLTNHFLLLATDVEPGDFAAKLNETIDSYKLDLEEPALQNIAGIYLSSLPMEDMHAKGNNKMLLIFLLIAILILVLSSINYLNYIISVQYSKLKETGISKTVGAGWPQLVLYSVTEVTLGILLSVIISIFITLLLLPSSEILFSRELQLSGVNVVQLLPAFLGTILLVILVNSVAPVVLLSRFNITDFLSGFGNRRGKQTGKQIMLTFQLTVSIVLIAVVLVIFKQLGFAKNYNLGFNKEMLVRIDLPFNNPNLESLKQETDKLAFVKNSSLSFGCPGMINNTMGSNTGENSFNLDCIFIGDDYLNTMGIELLDGRQLLNGDHGTACVINEEACKQYGWDNLEGKKFNNGTEGGYNVVGVVKNFHVKSLHQKVAPTALIYDTKKGEYNVLSVRLEPGIIHQQINQIREIWKEVIPGESMHFTFYDEQFQAMYAKEEKLAKSITFFSFIAIVLTCMGILGQIFMMSLNRTKEIGIRKVNGARVSEILTMLNKDFVKWVVIAFGFATPVAYFAMNKWLENFAYKTNLSWWIFALA
ncbi:MAG: ABC transporter permease, partial [Prolixibacteraceae bacterium]|nr:ABC transporter permease [Prolixibacteraceae bacterium]